MSFAYLDTHVAVYLYYGRTEELSLEAVRHIEAHDLLLSPMALLEFEYLYKKNRISVNSSTLFLEMQTTFGVGLCALPFGKVASEACTIGWTNDPFDRLIVAQAQANHRTLLITRDRLIRNHYAGAVW